MIVFSTDTFCWRIDERGASRAFLDRASGVDHLATPGTPVASIRRGAAVLSPLEAEEIPAGMRLVFPGGVTLDLAVEVHAAHLVVRVVGVSGEGVDAIEFVHVPLDIEPAAEPEAFCACAVALDLSTRVDAIPGPQAELRASCVARFGLEGAGAAIAGAPFSELRAALKRVVSEAPDLPASPLGGPWALDAPENRNSYLFGVATEETVDEWIALCRDLGIGQLHFCGGGAFRLGDYEPNPDLYPRGMAGLRAVIDKLHAAGLQAGLHTLSFSLAKNSRYVTPVPDPRLGADHVFALASAIDAGTPVIPLVEPTAGLPTYSNYKARWSTTLLIDEELIEYGAVRTEAPFAVSSCQRGAYGTRAAAHAKGAVVKNLKSCWAMFAPDENSTLFTEIAANIAGLINGGGFDMVYLDGLDGAQIFGSSDDRWHYAGRFAFEVFQRLDRPIIMEMAAFVHHLWFLRSRMGAWDHAARGHKHFIDLHCRSNANFRRIFLPGHLGWWAPHLGTGPKSETAWEDDVAYLCTKALADGIGFSIQGISPERVAAVPLFRRLVGVFRRYETLRRSGGLPAAVRTALGRPGAEFELDDSGAADGARFYPLQRHVHHTALPGAAGLTWEVENEMPAQVPRLRFEALWSAGDYDEEAAVPLAEFVDAGEFADNGPVRVLLNSGEDYEYPAAAPGMQAELAPWAAGGPGGLPAARFRAWREPSEALIPSSSPDDEFSIRHHGERFHRPRKASWIRRGKRFEPLLDLGERQAMGVWIHGDGRGEWLNFQLRSIGRFYNYSDYYVPVDFTGWRYVELLEPESDRFDVLSWPYAREVYMLHRHGVEYEGISALHLWMNNLRAGESAEVLLGPVRALPVVANVLQNPVLCLNGAAVSLDVDIESGCRVEVTGATGVLFGPQGERRREFSLARELPVLREGPNAVELRLESTRPRPRARVTLTCRGGLPVAG